MLGPHKAAAKPNSLCRCNLQNPPAARRQIGRSHPYSSLLRVFFPLDGLLDLPKRDTHLTQNHRPHTVLFFQNSQQNMLTADILAAQHLRLGNGIIQRTVCFFRKPLELIQQNHHPLCS